MVDQADRGDHRVEREHDVENGDLREDHTQSGDDRSAPIFFRPLQAIVNLVRGFGEQE